MKSKYFNPIYWLRLNTSDFRSGLSRSIDMFGYLENYEQSQLKSHEKDSLAIWGDWKTVADDILQAVQQYERTRTQPPEQRR